MAALPNGASTVGEGYKIYASYTSYLPSETDNERKTRLMKERARVIMIAALVIGILFSLGYLVGRLSCAC